MVFPEPVIHVAVEPKTKGDQEKMGLALVAVWLPEDPSFRVRTDESRVRPSSGMGELHLEIIVDRMKREFNVEANVGAPQVAYRETIRKTVRWTSKASSSSSPAVRPVRSRRHQPRAERAGQGFRVRRCGSRAVWFRANTSRRSTRASRKPFRTACSPASGGRREGHLHFDGSTTTWTRTKRRSRSLLRWPSKDGHAQGQPGAAWSR